MKLAEYLEKYIKDGRPLKGEHSEEPMLTYDELQSIKFELLELDEFKDVDDIVMHDIPSGVIDEKVVAAQTFILTKGVKFKGIVHLYSIYVGPRMYDKKLFAKPVKDNISALPTIYDLETFIPQKGLAVFWNLEQQQDDVAMGKTNEEVKEELVQKFRNALDNVDDYVIPSKRNIFIRTLGDYREIDKTDTTNFEKEVISL